MISEYIEQTPGAGGTQPRIKGRRIRVQDIAYYSEWCGWSPDRIASEFSLTLAQVHAALAYYFENIEEIREQMRDADRLYQEMKANSPSLLAGKLPSRGGSPSESKSA